MKDNFDLKKFLVENKSIENSNPYLNENQYEKDAEADDAEHIDALEKDMADDKKASLRKKVREMIINELGGDPELDYEGASEDGKYGDYDNDEESYYQHSHKTDIELEEMMDPEDEESSEMDADEALAQQMDADEYETYADAFGSMPFEESLEEAKEDEEEEIETDESEDTEEIEDEAPEEETEDEPKSGGGIEDLAADMKGDEGDLMDHLISALKVSKAMDNDKLTTQIGNTLKFFVGEYIGGEE